MRNTRISDRLYQLRQTGEKGVAFLIDPDDVWPESELERILRESGPFSPLFVLVGGSLVQHQNLAQVIARVKLISERLPVLLFPGSVLQLADNADGILFISMISGRNPELLIGQHVLAAPLLAKSGLEVLPTGYLLIDGGKLSSVHYMSQSVPLPNDKPELTLATAMAGHFLGLKFLYLEAGSGAPNPVSVPIIESLRNHLPCPLLVGGGLDSLSKVKAAWKAGADLVVLGNSLKKNPGLLAEVLNHAEEHNLSLNIN